MRLDLATFLISWIVIITQVTSAPLPSISSLETSSFNHPLLVRDDVVTWAISWEPPERIIRDWNRGLDDFKDKVMLIPQPDRNKVIQVLKRFVRDGTTYLSEKGVVIQPSVQDALLLSNARNVVANFRLYDDDERLQLQQGIDTLEDELYRQLNKANLSTKHIAAGFPPHD